MADELPGKCFLPSSQLEAQEKSVKEDGKRTRTGELTGDMEGHTLMMPTRSFEPGEGSISGANKKRKANEDDGDGNQAAKLALMDDAANEAFTCSICQDIFHDCVATAPCQHNFCNACFSHWHRQCLKKGEAVSCPTCRSAVVSAARNPTIRSLIEVFLKAHPDRERSAEERAQLDKDALVTSVPFVIQKGKGPVEYESEEESDEYGSDDESDEEELDKFCPQCPGPLQSPDVGGSAAQPGADNGFRCLPHGTHLECSQCTRLIPLRVELLDQTTCSICSKAFCNSYWMSQGQPGCGGPNPVTLVKLGEKEFTEMPKATYGGNKTEQEILTKYLEGKNVTVKDLVASCIEKLDNDEYALPQLGLMVAPNTPLQPVPTSPVKSSTIVCNGCADVIACDLLYLFLKGLPKEELPRGVAKRQDCWYGRECRTQFHKESHQRLNHVCEATPPQNRARG